MDEKNEAKYSQTRDLAHSPEKVMRAARAVLDQLTRESDPQASESVQAAGDSIETGWVYGKAKDKYVRYDYNGTPQRRPLAVRRIYNFIVQESLAGSLVKMKVKEELQQINLKTGKHEDWKKVEADPATYDLLLRRLQEEIREE